MTEQTIPEATRAAIVELKRENPGFTVSYIAQRLRVSRQTVREVLGS